MRKPSKKVVRRSLTVLASLLALGGIAFAAFPFATDLWTQHVQDGLETRFEASADTFALGNFKVGDPLTRIEIPAIDVNTIVVEGATPAALRAGAGHYAKTALPGQAGNVAIAGHRTTYGKPFNRMDELVPGDKIVLTTPLGRYVYEVSHRPFVVDPTDWSTINDFPKDAHYLTLTSCHPEGSAAYRIVVRAELTESSDAVAQVGK